MSFLTMTSSEFKAFDIRRKFNVNYNEKIDLYGLTEDLNIKVVERSLNEKVLGACKTKGIKRIILLNNNIDYEKRKRFTLAHEIGHLVLEHGDQYCDKKNFYIREIERDANAFASELLVPSKYIKEYVHDKDVTCESIISVSNRFDVSYSVASIALLKNMDDSWVMIYNKDKAFSSFFTWGLFYKTHPLLHKILYEYGENVYELKNLDTWFPNCYFSQCFVETKKLSDGNYLSLLKFV